MNALLLHQWVDRYNWDDGLAPIWVIAESPKTELATALLIYWRLGGPWLETAGSANSDAKQLQDFVQKQILAGFYARGSAAFDPKQKLTQVQLYQLRKSGLPEVLLGGESGQPADVS